MPARARASYTPPIGDDAVQAKTGRKWDEWFAVLDAAGAARLSHKEIVAIVRDQHGVGPWWQQMVTVTYEQARGLREKYETTAGYQVGVSRTLPASAADVYRAWSDARVRRRWLKAAGLTLRKGTPGKSLRMAWDGASSVDVNLYPKGDAKTQVQVQHSKLRSAAEVKRQKAFWTAALEALKQQLAG